MVPLSHDRRFLDRVCTRLLELSHGAPGESPEHYSAYVKLRGERRARRETEWEVQQQYIAQSAAGRSRIWRPIRREPRRRRQRRLQRLSGPLT